MSGKLWGCYNRQPLKHRAVVQDGWFATVADEKAAYVITRVPVMIEIPDPMTKDCQHSIDADDPKCGDCRWKNRTP
jgi:hypothetical protein